MKELQMIEELKGNQILKMTVDDARENYMKEAWLNGLDGQPSEKQQMEKELEELRQRNA